IEKWKSEGKSNRVIASLLGKAPQTIHNEVKRGLVRQQVRKGKFELVYQADYAQDRYERKRQKSVRPVNLDEDTKDKIL
ncbi:helix-turn-helix domain-containing protein, partial [Streptococcus pyogenes]